ncbi:hypothetical protein GALL_439800 [mine drainage metagenome]|uniref:Uncharacterized protein n=1 Tax=mine drainage metagenome TaxID=410659 RepID=A0A1J5PU52_9ZZZZ
MDCFKAAAVEVLLHGEAGSQQTHALVTPLLDGQRRGVGNVQQGNADRCLNRIGHFVHGVGAQHQAIGAGTRQCLGGLGQQGAGCIPLASGLQVFDLREIDAVQNEFGRVQAAQPLLHPLVDFAVVGHGGLPAHAADQAQGLHDFALMGWIYSGSQTSL